MEDHKHNQQYGSTGAVIIFFILLFIYSKFGPSLPINVSTQQRGEPFVVSAQGKAVITPDIAKITLGIEENGSSLKTIQDSVNKKSKALTDQLKDLGIDDKNIKTTAYNVYPNYDYNSPIQRITGYRVSASYEVKVVDFDKVNEVVTIATQVGVNSIGNITFEVNEDTKQEKLNEARKMAVDEAKEKAEGLAKSASISLGKIINVSESSMDNVGRPVAFLEKTDAAGMGGDLQTANITPGESEINVTVSLSYEVR